VSISIVPANQASCDDLQAIFGARGPAVLCQCQRFKLRPREAFRNFPVEERAHRLRVQTECGNPQSDTTIRRRGLHRGSRPTLRRAVVRIDFQGQSAARQPR
jgi:hypothetical protein